MSRLADDQMIPAIEWFAEQMPGGFFVYRADGFLPKPFFAKSVLEQFKTVMTEGRKERFYFAEKIRDNNS